MQKNIIILIRVLISRYNYDLFHLIMSYYDSFMYDVMFMYGQIMNSIYILGATYYNYIVNVK